MLRFREKVCSATFLFFEIFMQNCNFEDNQVQAILVDNVLGWKWSRNSVSVNKFLVDNSKLENSALFDSKLDRTIVVYRQKKQPNVNSKKKFKDLKD